MASDRRVFIVSKGRADNQMTSRVLSGLGVKHYVVVEPSQVAAYNAKRTEHAVIMPLDLSYKDRYDTCDDLGLAKSTGPGPARNFVWDYAADKGIPWHWVMDDNIAFFSGQWAHRRRMFRGAPWMNWCEDFVTRFSNVGMFGPEYDFFVLRYQKHHAWTWPTRVYSCNLIRTDLPMRWRGRYNEDTILSLDMLQAGLVCGTWRCVVQKKTATQQLVGGNTDEFYSKEGTAPKSEMLARVYPKFARLVKRWNRAHHVVDYKRAATKEPCLIPGKSMPTVEELIECCRGATRDG